MLNILLSIRPNSSILFCMLKNKKKRSGTEAASQMMEAI